MPSDALTDQSRDPPHLPAPCPYPRTQVGAEERDKAQPFGGVPCAFSLLAAKQMIWMLYHIQFVNISPTPDFLLA